MSVIRCLLTVAMNLNGTTPPFFKLRRSRHHHPLNPVNPLNLLNPGHGVAPQPPPQPSAQRAVAPLERSEHNPSTQPAAPAAPPSFFTAAEPPPQPSAQRAVAPLSEANTTLLHNLRRQPRPPLLKLRRSRHNNPRAKGPSNLRTFRTKDGQSLEPCQYPPRRVLTTAFIHDNVVISIENDEEKSSHTENGEASPESGSGYG